MYTQPDQGDQPLEPVREPIPQEIELESLLSGSHPLSEALKSTPITSIERQKHAVAQQRYNDLSKEVVAYQEIHGDLFGGGNVKPYGNLDYEDDGEYMSEFNERVRLSQSWVRRNPDKAQDPSYAHLNGMALHPDWKPPMDKEGNPVGWRHDGVTWVRTFEAQTGHSNWIGRNESSEYNQ